MGLSAAVHTPHMRVSMCEVPLRNLQKSEQTPVVAINEIYFPMNRFVHNVKQHNAPFNFRRTIPVCATDAQHLSVIDYQCIWGTDHV